MCKTEFKSTNKMAFLSAFFFMSFYTFYDQEPRQWVAELFLVLAIYLIIRTDLRKPKENALLVLFVASLAVSHYSVSYVFLYYVVIFIVGYPLLVERKASAQRRYGLPLLVERTVSAQRRYGLRLLTAALLFVIVGAWYIMASGGGPFYAFLQLWAHTVSSLASGMFATQDPHVAAGLGANVPKLSLLHKIGNYWIIATTPIIALGLAIMVWRRKTSQINPKALLFSLASFVTMAVAVVVPTLGAAMNGNRAYALALIFLAPCCVFGLVAISDKIAELIRANDDLARRLRYAVLIGVLIPYFFFNYGVIFEIVDTPSNYAFMPSAQQSQRVIAYNYSKDWSYFVQSPTPKQAVSANAWLGGSIRGQTVYVDSSSTAMGEVFGYGNVSPNEVVLLSGKTRLPPSTPPLFIWAR